MNNTSFLIDRDEWTLFRFLLKRRKTTVRRKLAAMIEEYVSTELRRRPWRISPDTKPERSRLRVYRNPHPLGFEFLDRERLIKTSVMLPVGIAQQFIPLAHRDADAGRVIRRMVREFIVRELRKEPLPARIAKQLADLIPERRNGQQPEISVEDVEDWT